MSEDWKAGDVAVCIEPAERLVMNAMYRVCGITSWGGVDRNGRKCAYGLRLRELSSDAYKAYSPFRFRKLPSASDEFTAQMRACKPHRERQPA